MSASCIRRMIVTFNRDEILISVTCSHDSPPAGGAGPGSKKRTTTAARMAAEGLRTALRYLETSEPISGGFATNTQVSTDTIVIDREKRAAA